MASCAFRLLLISRARICNGSTSSFHHHFVGHRWWVKGTRRSIEEGPFLFEHKTRKREKGERANEWLWAVQFNTVLKGFSKRNKNLFFLLFVLVLGFSFLPDRNRMFDDALANGAHAQKRLPFQLNSILGVSVCVFMCLCVCVYVLESESKMRWDAMHCWTWPNRTGLWSSFRADMKSLRHTHTQKQQQRRHTNTRERKSLACFCFYVQHCTASTHEHWYHVCCCLFCCQIFWLIIIIINHLGHLDWCFCWTHCWWRWWLRRLKGLENQMHQRIQSLADWRPANGLKIQVSRHLIIISNQQKAVCIAMDDKKRSLIEKEDQCLNWLKLLRLCVYSLWRIEPVCIRCTAHPEDSFQKEIWCVCLSSNVVALGGTDGWKT